MQIIGRKDIKNLVDWYFLLGEKYLSSLYVWANRGYLANEYVVSSQPHEESFKRLLTFESYYLYEHA